MGKPSHSKTGREGRESQLLLVEAAGEVELGGAGSGATLERRSLGELRQQKQGGSVGGSQTNYGADAGSERHNGQR